MAKQPPTKKAPVKNEAPVSEATTDTAKPAKKAVPKFNDAALALSVKEKMPMVAHATIERVIAATFSAMIEAYKEGKVVDIKDYGRLEIQHRAARTGRNPQTGAAIEIAAKSVPKFTFAKALKAI